MEGIGIALLVCLLLLLVSRRISMPAIPLYILSGMILGGSGLGIVENSEVSGYLVGIGLTFLLFYVGLELKPSQIRKSGKKFLYSGLIDLNINLILGSMAAYAFGFSPAESLVIGASLYISSSAIVLASLTENRKLVFREAETIIWLMIFEDIVLAFMILFLSVGDGNLFMPLISLVMLVTVIFVIVYLLRGGISALLEKDDEIPVFFTFSTVVFTAFFAEYIGVHSSLAVIALGSALSMTNPEVLEANSRPFKDVFMVLFFVFFGVSVQISGNMSILLILAMSVVAMLTKVLTGLLIGRTVHGSYISGIEIGTSIIPRAEFSIAIAALYGSPVVSGIVAGVVIVTSFAGSFLARYSVMIKKFVHEKTGLE